MSDFDFTPILDSLKPKQTQWRRLSARFPANKGLALRINE